MSVMPPGSAVSGNNWTVLYRLRKFANRGRHGQGNACQPRIINPAQRMLARQRGAELPPVVRNNKESRTLALRLEEVSSVNS